VTPIDCYPSLAAVHPALADLPASSGPHTLPAGYTVFAAQQPCQGFPLLLQGEVRVFQSSADGRSLELYRVGAGELCLVSTASLFRQQPMAATGVTTQLTRLLVVPGGVFQTWLGQPAFRNDILGLFAQRMADLSGLVDAVAFQRLDQRLAAALLGHGPALVTTHQALADQLGTVREIVSRLLQRFAQDGWVSLSRERITIVDSAALRHLAAK
jgi:CRP/FNR family transcriptional regulator